VLLANKLVEEKLHATSQRLELATYTGGIGIWELNLMTKSLIWDDQMLALFGITREDFTGTHEIFQKAIHPDEWERVEGELFAAIKQGNPMDTEFRIYWPDGSLHHIKSNAIILADEEGRTHRLIGVNWDITSQKRSEETLKEALKKEKELGELKTRFVSRASHEFRTPLAAILATTETLTIYRAKMTETQMDSRLDKIHQQIMHLKGIMEDVLELSRIQSGRIDFRPSQGNMDELCQNIITEFESQAENKKRIIYSGPNTPLIATFDSRLIRQVISNLTSNALKYSSVEKPVYLNLSQSSTQITLTVKDEGIGIPLEDIKDLFEPFQRASNVGTIAGTGLGLSIALQAVEMHGGTISVESVLSVGSTFTLVIPVKGKENDEDINN
jgi:signal transduction histidine kinase